MSGFAWEMGEKKKEEQAERGGEGRGKRPGGRKGQNGHPSQKPVSHSSNTKPGCEKASSCICKSVTACRVQKKVGSSPACSWLSSTTHITPAHWTCISSLDLAAPQSDWLANDNRLISSTLSFTHYVHGLSNRPMCDELLTRRFFNDKRRKRDDGNGHFDMSVVY